MSAPSLHLYTLGLTHTLKISHRDPHRLGPLGHGLNEYRKGDFRWMKRWGGGWRSPGTPAIKVCCNAKMQKLSMESVIVSCNKTGWGGRLNGSQY